MLKKKNLQLLIALLLPAFMMAQVTTSNIAGIVKSSKGEALTGATVTATHLPTGTVYTTTSRTGGRYTINNVQPGGPYTVEVTYVGFEKQKKEEVYLNLGETGSVDVVLGEGAAELAAVVVSGVRRTADIGGKGGAGTTIGRDQMQALPTVGRNIADYLRAVPQAKLTNSEGGISIAGQNNRYNSFYVDGAVNNDVFGLSASGTNGGQAAIAPISIDAIDQFQVVISPYDASLGNFVGGGINAITRSGTNTTQGSVYYIYRNQNLTGKDPTGDKSTAKRLGDFSNKTYGFRLGGALVKNKLFYFINAEQQRDLRPQPFDLSSYTGNTKLDSINILLNALKTKYNYDAGSFLDNPEKVNADRISAKIDWNISRKHKLSVSHRYTKGDRYNTVSSSTTAINFYNNGYLFPTRTNSTSLELKSNFSANTSNKLLITYTDVLDDRNPLGDPFPRIQILDNTGTSSGNGLIVGPDNSSTQNKLTQKNFSFFDAFKVNLGKHVLTFGTDNEINDAFNVFIQNTYGNYQYNNLQDFLNDAKPRQYSVGYSLIDNKTDDNTAAAAKFKTMRLALFVNDEYRATENLTLNFGIRADYSRFLTQPATDAFTNDSALPKFSEYYDLQGARSGLRPSIPVSISPRLGFTYKIPEESVTIRGGLGLFTGRIPLVWPGGIYNNNGINQGGFTASSSQNTAALDVIRFRSNPFGQWRASDVGITLSKGGLNLIAEKFKMPKVFRTSLAVDKRIGEVWTFTVEGILTKNINEINYTNINILPPSGNSVGPDRRMVYPAPNTIPITANGRNPYDNAILLSNAQGSKGYSYNFTFTIDKRMQNGFGFNVNYTYGDAYTINEGTSSVNLSQWRFMETVNGRNNITRSRSDFSQGHRIFAYVSKKFTYLKKSLATTVSLVYTGQSGAPFSYVYSGAVVRDDASGGNDLMYVPTSSDIQGMTFLNNTIPGSTPVTYTPEQQKAALEAYISDNSYLNNRRGQYAERNGARLPFTNIIDLKIIQDFNVRVGKNRYQFQLTYDMFNFTNFLNRTWGRTYFLSNDNYALVSFAGYKSSSDLTPQYRYNPQNNTRTPWGISTSTVPSYIARWTSQIGLRFNFN
ncbi:TonB-dependent receptor [Foetidibacter luteolus]|uniref:TonB-dependent receptor n=1 Tax=Foetidibacter luteolus TaxID=2608880 RepID=UPI001A9979E8|nr:TonB-dependent receptor [Foetidibacter luteolus]